MMEGLMFTYNSYTFKTYTLKQRSCFDDQELAFPSSDPPSLNTGIFIDKSIALHHLMILTCW